jgi:hypothetical protein
MASKLVRGKDGRVVCPFCGSETTYEIEDYGTGLVVFALAEDTCDHLAAAEWEVLKDGKSVEVLVYSEDEEGE